MKNLVKLTAIIVACMVFIVAPAAKAALPSPVIPNEVEKQFANQYPSAHLKKWKFENGQYQAWFADKGTTIIAIYSDQGKWEESVTKLKNSAQLPEAIRTTFEKSKYRNYYIDKIEQISKPEGVKYLVKIDNYNGNSAITEGYGQLDDEELTFDETGALLKVTDPNGPDTDDI